MLIFTYAYVLLALASWSALAVPLFGPDKGNAQKRSLSSSILMSRDGASGPGPEILNSVPSNTNTSGPNHDSSAMDCDNDKDKDKGNNNDNAISDASFPTNLNMNAIYGIGPAMNPGGRRSMRRGTKTSVASIFERDNAPTHTSPSKPKPMTVGDILNQYYKQKQRKSTRKRAERPRTSRDFN